MSEKKILLIYDFSIKNPPDFLIEQLNYLPNGTNVWILGRNVFKSGIQSKKYSLNFVEIKDSKFDYKLYTFLRRLKSVRQLEIFFKPHSLLKLMILVMRINPKLVHIHGLGGRTVPTFAIPLIRCLARKKVVITHHGFSPLNGGAKLYPNELISQSVPEIDVRDRAPKRFLRTSSRKLSKSSFINELMLKLTIFSVNRANLNIAISPLQARIFNDFGIRVDEIIPNLCSPCACMTIESTQTNKFDDSRIVRVLFMGRPIGKGLERIARLAKGDSNIHLMVAGHDESDNYIRLLGIPSSQYSFLGYLDKKSLYPLIHEVDIVACLSECFDNFPTVALEALYHGSIPIVTPCTGVSEMLASIHHQLVWPIESENDSVILKTLISNQAKILLAIESSGFNSDLYQKSRALIGVYLRHLS